MTTINVADPARTNMDAAMESIGFTVDVQDEYTSDYTWDDAGGYAKLRYVQDSTLGNNNYMYYQHWFGGSPTSIIYIAALPNTQAAKICYEPLANSGVAIGFTNISNTPLQVAFIAPASEDDNWIATNVALSTCNYARLKLISYRLNSPYDNDNGYITAYSNDVQIVKAYDGQRFTDNLYLTILGPSIGGNDNVRATIGNKNYLILGNSFPVKVALELPS